MLINNFLSQTLDSNIYKSYLAGKMVHMPNVDLHLPGLEVLCENLSRLAEHSLSP